jgi:hypothetical protein
MPVGRLFRSLPTCWVILLLPLGAVLVSSTGAGSSSIGAKGNTASERRPCFLRKEGN